MFSWRKKATKKRQKENLTQAAEQPIPQPPLTTSEIKRGGSAKNFDFFKKRRPRNTFREERQPSGLPKGIVWGIAGIVGLFVVGFIVSLVVAKHQISHSIATHSLSLSAGIKDLQDFDPQGAEREFAALGIVTSGTEGPLGMLAAVFQGGGGALGSFADLSRQLVLLPQEYEALQTDLFSATNTASLTEQRSGSISEASSMQSNGASSTLSTDLTALRNTVDALDDDTNQMSAGISQLGGTVSLGGNNYVALKSELHGAREFLDEFAPWVATSTPHHVLVLFLNPAELRPGGGFLGSYADVAIANGGIESVAVHDVADVDGGFTQNIVPPKALQAEIKRFRPADANWFFDFPTTASETISLFQSSNLYSGVSTSSIVSPSSTSIPYTPYPIPASISFDGVIAISPAVLTDLLSVTGPVMISVSSTPSGSAVPVTFTSSTAMIQIQKLVQDGQAQSATYPKQILRSLADAMVTELASSTDAEKQGLLTTAAGWVNQKDIMAYFTDPAFENFLTTYGAGGDVYQVPQNFNGDYLADVDANINGGKSDAYVSSTVTWQSEINADGTLSDSVIIDRTHLGNTSPYWWYQVTNQDYLQLFVPEASTLTNESGGAAKAIVPKVNYARLGYAMDSTIATIESSTQPLFGYPAVTTHEEDGKEVFATWVTTKSGASSEVSFEYSHHAFSLPAAGVSYQFIFEKQASTVRHYSFEFDAPLGYQFAENGLPSYHYESDAPPGRLIITLTLQKI